MIPQRHLQRPNQNQQAPQNDHIPLQQKPGDFFQGQSASGGMLGSGPNAGLGGLNMQNLPNLQAALNNGMGNDDLNQQLRLFRANQELLLAARYEQDGLSFARRSLNQQPQGLHQNNMNLPPQLLDHHFGGLHPGMVGVKNNKAPSFQSEAILSEAYQRGKDEVLRSLLQARNAANCLDSGLGNMPNQFHHISNLRNIGSNMGNIGIMGSMAPQPDKLSALVSKDPNHQALEQLGTTSIERRKKNSPYFDASSLTDPGPVALANRRTRGGVTEPFPEKLHRMLREVESNDNSDIIGFLGHGRAFAIHDPDRFCKEVMPSYFKQSRLSSFQRQLNLYGFTRMTNGPDAGGYYHELFLRGRAALAVHMRRVGVTSTTSNYRSIRPRGNMPDFYNMVPVQEEAPLEAAGAENNGTAPRAA